MRLFAITILALVSVIGGRAEAINVQGPPSQEKLYITQLLANVVRPVLSTLPVLQKDRLKNVTIYVAQDSLHNSSPVAGYQQSGSKVIVFPTSWVALLADVAVLNVMAESYGEPHLPERWMYQLMWRTVDAKTTKFGAFYDGPAPQSPFSYTGIDPEEFIKEHGNVVEGLSVAATLDILLHELGHFALDNIYNPRTAPSRVMKESERSADRWASATFRKLPDLAPDIGLIDKHNVSGRVFALSALREVDHWKRSSRSAPSLSHPTVDERIEYAVSDIDCLNAPSICSFVDGIRDRWSQDQRDSESYKARAEEGETFAYFMLATLTFSRGDRKGGCAYFRDAMGKEDSMIDRIALHVAWCHENGFYKDGIPNKESMRAAKALYGISARAGWVEGKVGVARLNGYE